MPSRPSISATASLRGRADRRQLLSQRGQAVEAVHELLVWQRPPHDFRIEFTGIDCCGGYCYSDMLVSEFMEPTGTCSPVQAMCSKRDEKCLVDADCCPPDVGDSPNVCIAGFCAYVPVL